LFNSPLAEKIGLQTTLRTGLRDPGTGHPGPSLVRSDRIKTYLANIPEVSGSPRAPRGSVSPRFRQTTCNCTRWRTAKSSTAVPRSDQYDDICPTAADVTVGRL